MGAFFNDLAYISRKAYRILINFFIVTQVCGDLARLTNTRLDCLTCFIGHFYIHTPVALQVSVCEGSVNGLDGATKVICVIGLGLHSARQTCDVLGNRKRARVAYNELDRLFCCSGAQ